MKHCTLRSAAEGPTMLRPDATPLPAERPSLAALDARDRAFGVVPPRRPKAALPLVPPDPTRPLPPREFVAQRVGYAFALPPLEFRIVGATYAARARLRRQAALDEILDAVAAAFGIDRMLLVSPRRDKFTAQARIAAYRLLHEFTSWSMPEIARALRRTDHSTVMSGLRRARFLIEVESPFAGRFFQARAIIETKIGRQPAGDTP